MPSFQKHIRSIPQQTILKHVNILAKVNKLPHGRLQNMMSREAYIIIIQVWTLVTNKRIIIPLSTEQDIKSSNAIIQL